MPYYRDEPRYDPWNEPEAEWIGCDRCETGWVLDGLGYRDGKDQLCDRCAAEVKRALYRPELSAHLVRQWQDDYDRRTAAARAAAVAETTDEDCPF